MRKGRYLQFARLRSRRRERGDGRRADRGTAWSRRSEDSLSPLAREIPACAEEVRSAEEEGVVLEMLARPVGFQGDEWGRVRRMHCERMELGEPDESGRRRPRPVPGSNFAIPTDLVIVAIGYAADPLMARSTPGVALNRWGNIQTNERGRTSKRGVWSGGDIVTGAATVVQAMGAGRRAAGDMHEWLASGGEDW